MVKVVSAELEKVRVEQYHSQGLNADSQNYHSVSLALSMKGEAHAYGSLRRTAILPEEFRSKFPGIKVACSSKHGLDELGQCDQKCRYHRLRDGQEAHQPIRNAICNPEECRVQG